MKRNVRIYLKDIIDNITFAESIVQDENYDQFVEDIKSQYASVHCLEIIGEATKHIPDTLRDKYPSIPWRNMAGMRDKISHFYFGVNIKAVWKTIKLTISVVRPLIEKAYRETPDE